MQIWILADLNDHLALQVGAGLRQRYGRQAVQVVAPEALAMAPYWSHRLWQEEHTSPASSLHVESDIQLASGAWLRSRQVGAVFNRLVASAAPQFTASSQDDQVYAQAELNALWVSWLSGLRGQGVQVVNPAGYYGLSPNYSRLQWLDMAAQACLAILPQQVDSHRPHAGDYPQGVTLLAAGDQLVLPNGLEFSLDPDLPDKVKTLQETCACPLLEIRFVPVHQDLIQDHAEGYASHPASIKKQRLAWLVEQVNPFPRQANPAGLQAILALLGEAWR